MLLKHKKVLIAVTAILSICIILRLVTFNSSNNISRINKTFNGNIQSSIYSVFKITDMEYIVYLRSTVSKGTNQTNSDDSKKINEFTELWKEIPNLKVERTCIGSEMFNQNICYIGISAAIEESINTNSSKREQFSLYVDPSNNHIYLQKLNEQKEVISQKELYIELNRMKKLLKY